MGIFIFFLSDEHFNSQHQYNCVFIREKIIEKYTLKIVKI